MYRQIRIRALAAALFAGFGACAASVTILPSVPDALRVAPTQALELLAHARGVQAYACGANPDAGYAWTPATAEAELFDRAGNRIGRQYAGPTWEASDGSRVAARPQARADAPDERSLPWLRLAATAHQGAGVLARVADIQRIDTDGGLAPALPCDAMHAGSEVRVPFAATYYFYGAAS